MDGLAYFNHGTKHLTRLVVSLWSLRKHYRGPVCILDTGESGVAAERIAQIGLDRRLNVQVEQVDLVQCPKHACYVTKPTLWRRVPYRRAIFMDADTVIAGDIAHLLEGAAEFGMVLTQFSSWTSQTPIIRDRISKWRDIEPGCVNTLLSFPFPAVNTGVYAVDIYKRRDDLEAWEMLTYQGRHLFICDEIAMQLLVPAVEHAMLDDRWNCSPIYGVNKREAVIWHCHGGKHLRPEAAPIWEPALADAVEHNIAGIAGWERS